MMTWWSASRRWLVLFCLALLLGGFALPTPPVAAANTLHVTDCGDAGANALRGNIGSAGVGDTIVFDQNCIITLTTGTLTLTRGVTINGTGHAITVDGNGMGSGFTVNQGVTATINGLTIQHGTTTTNGGGIYNDGTLTITNCTLSGNTAGGVGTDDGGGTFNDVHGNLKVTNYTISSNNVDRSGSGIANYGVTTVTNSTLSGNGTGRWPSVPSTTTTVAR